MISAIDLIGFNGWVQSVDASTGRETNACILTVVAQRLDFLEINLIQVDPKACFKKLKGVGSSKLHSLSPVAPLIQLSRNDRRFIWSAPLK
jgi:restriction system protein